MTAISTNGLETWLTKGAATLEPVAPSAITKAAPAVVTVVDVAPIKEGDLIEAINTGFKELDGRWFVVGNVNSTANTFELIGSDTTDSTGSLVASPSLSYIKEADMVKLCLSSVDPASEAAGTTSVGTFCDPSATIPALAQAGTLTLTGYVDLGAAYQELIKATEDGKERILKIVLPQNLGFIVVPAVLSTIAWALPLDGAVGFTVTGAMSTKPRHLF